MSTEEDVQAALKTILDKNADKLGKTFGTVAANIFVAGVAPKDAVGMSDTTMERLYSQAYQCYNTGKYIDASRIFQTLILMNTADARYTLGLAACLHLLKDYEAAAEAYMYCSVLDPDSPIPSYHASDCFMHLDDTMSALIMMELVVKKAGDKPQYSIIKDRAQLSISQLKPKFEKEGWGYAPPGAKEKNAKGEGA